MRSPARSHLSLASPPLTPPTPSQNAFFALLAQLSRAPRRTAARFRAPRRHYAGAIRRGGHRPRGGADHAALGGVPARRRRAHHRAHVRDLRHDCPARRRHVAGGWHTSRAATGPGQARRPALGLRRLKAGRESRPTGAGRRRRPGRRPCGAASHLRRRYLDDGHGRRARGVDRRPTSSSTYSTKQLSRSARASATTRKCDVWMVNRTAKYTSSSTRRAPRRPASRSLVVLAAAAAALVAAGGVAVALSHAHSLAASPASCVFTHRWASSRSSFEAGREDAGTDPPLGGSLRFVGAAREAHAQQRSTL